jgi:hypothetical protein
MTLTVVSNPVNGGTTTCEPASVNGSYYPTDNVTVTATAKPGYKFVNWTGDVAEIENNTRSTIVVPMDKYYPDMKQPEITANFEKTGRFPWKWVGGGLAALLLAAVALAIVARRRKKHQADTQAP